MSPTARSEGVPDPWERLVGAALLAALVVVAAPTLAVAAALAVALDRRGWRRWPAATGGLAAAAVLGWAGGARAYLGVAAAVGALALRRASDAPHGVPLAAGFAAAAGVALAPALVALVHHRDEHEETRHARRASAHRRAATRAARRVRRARWPTPTDRAVLGVPIEAGAAGDGRRPARRVVAVPMRDWLRQALIVGETGSGKTMTALTVAGEAMRAEWDVHWIDGKADPAVAERFLALAADHGRSARDATRDPLDGWRGGPDSIVNRLLASQSFTEPYYEGIARNVLRWAVGVDPPHSFRALVERMDKRSLRRRWRDDPAVADTIRRLPEADLLGTRYRYEGVGWAVGTSLDGTWSYEDVRAAYVPVGRPEHRHQAGEVGAFLLEDLLHWAMARKDPARPALVVVDEFSRLAGRPDAAVDLVERVRTFGVGVVLIAQTWASLGPSDTVRERLAGTVGTIVVHQLKVPERLAALAGTAWTLERSEQLLDLAPTGSVTQRAARRFVVSPDDVRALRSGEAFLVTGAAACRLRVRAPHPPRARRRTRDQADPGGGYRRRRARPHRVEPIAVPSPSSHRGTPAMPMREDCRHFESRTYDSGEVARYCVLGLAPEQPWRCPEHCDRYEVSLIGGGFVTGSLERPPVEPEPDDSPEATTDVLDDAEAIVEGAEHDVERDLQRDEAAATRSRWKVWKRRPPDDDTFRISNR